VRLKNSEIDEIYDYLFKYRANALILTAITINNAQENFPFKGSYNLKGTFIIERNSKKTKNAIFGFGLIHFTSVSAR